MNIISSARKRIPVHKKDYIDKLMVEREAEAKKARQLKKKQAYKPDPEASFSWSANTSTRGRR